MGTFLSPTSLNLCIPTSWDLEVSGLAQAHAPSHNAPLHHKPQVLEPDDHRLKLLKL